MKKTIAPAMTVLAIELKTNMQTLANDVGTLPKDVFAFVFNSCRPAGIQLLKDEGYNRFVNFMIDTKKMTVPRRRK